MSFSDSRTELTEFTEMVPVHLPNGAIAKIEIARTEGREDVGFGAKQFQEVGKTIAGIAEALAVTIKKTAPTKATVKFGLEVEIEQGSLVAAIVRGKGKTHLEITLEWMKQPNQEEENEEEEDREETEQEQN